MQEEEVEERGLTNEGSKKLNTGKKKREIEINCERGNCRGKDECGMKNRNK